MKRIFFILTAFVVLLSACAPKNAYYETPALGLAPMSMESTDSANYSQGVAPAPSETVERMVIKNASLTLVVTDPRTSQDDIQTIVENLGGYIVSSELYTSTS